MPVCNGAQFLNEAIQSVLTQTYPFFELIILNDGSADNCLDIMRQYAASDPRVRVVSRPNKGLCETINELLELAQNEIVFMMHADDVMLVNRVERQILFLKDNPAVDICSSFVDYINDAGEIIGKYSSPLTTMAAVKTLAEKNEIVGFNHPSTAFRRSVIKKLGGYRQQFWPCEDIDLWNRAVEVGVGICVIPETLLRYRIHGSSASVARSTLLRKKHHYVKTCMLRRREALSEFSWEEFLQLWDKRPMHEKLNSWRKDTAKGFYKKAVFAYAQKKYGSLAVALIPALIFQPVCVIKQVVSKYGN